MTVKRRRRVHAEGRVPIYHSVLAVSNRVLNVCGCKKIESYSPAEIRLELREMRLTVSGEGLALGTGCGDMLEIRGKVESVDFIEN